MHTIKDNDIQMKRLETKNQRKSKKVTAGLH